jgi:hypothetical protein
MSKSAMQELIEAVNKHYSNPLRTDIFDTNPFLEKEKEQIIDAWIATDNKLQRLAAEEYYNQTYNQQ